METLYYWKVNGGREPFCHVELSFYLDQALYENAMLFQPPVKAYDSKSYFKIKYGG